MLTSDCNEHKIKLPNLPIHYLEESSRNKQTKKQTTIESHLINVQVLLQGLWKTQTDIETLNFRKVILKTMKKADMFYKDHEVERFLLKLTYIKRICHIGFNFASHCYWLMGCCMISFFVGAPLLKFSQHAGLSVRK